MMALLYYDQEEDFQNKEIINECNNYKNYSNCRTNKFFINSKYTHLIAILLLDISET